ncbi:PTS sugar transporter subunit IIA [Pontivivens ytuae]|uniref:PTS fructose transporter subunit IIA n=1 Tax=Pontivivens ytuae TaxID=2789856 RepID=A0A7S9QD14_9RHOB|nr:PTS fructose transporter subunit IIA [Pontivivens ytuae]QPH54410.1 PTS fructose transporter subunit IIA [Pontivivens ytuae]
MFGIVIVAHGGLAKEYLSALQHVVGELDGVRAISVGPEDSLTSRQDEICAATEAVNTGDGVVLVTDLIGSTPSNLAMKACTRREMDVIYGANMPLLVQLAKSRHRDRRVAVNAALDTGRRCLDARRSPATPPTPKAPARVA